MPDAKPQISIEGWRPLVKNTLRGFVNVKIPFGGATLVVKEITVHRKGDRVWTGMPAKPTLSPEGVARRDEQNRIRYQNILEWSSREMNDRFSAKVIELIETQYPGGTS